MKNHFLQRGMTAVVSSVVVGPIIAFLLIMDVSLIDKERAQYGHTFLIIACGVFLIFCLIALALGLQTTMYVDETGIRACKFQRELWFCAWNDIVDVVVSSGQLRAVVFKISYSNMDTEVQKEIEVTRKSKSVLSHYCGRNEFRERFISAKPYF